MEREWKLLHRSQKRFYNLSPPSNFCSRRAATARAGNDKFNQTSKNAKSGIKYIYIYACGWLMQSVSCAAATNSQSCSTRNKSSIGINHASMIKCCLYSLRELYICVFIHIRKHMWERAANVGDHLQRVWPQRAQQHQSLSSFSAFNEQIIISIAAVHEWRSYQEREREQRETHQVMQLKWRELFLIRLLVESCAIKLALISAMIALIIVYICITGLGGAF